MASDSGWALVLPIGAGLGVLCIGIGVLIVCLRLATVLTRVNTTLDVVDAQINGLAAPVTATLAHVGGIAGTADVTVAKLGGVADQAEILAQRVVRTATLAQDAVSPALVNLGATLTGVTAGLRRIVRGRDTRGPGAL